jgi:hypothetical protein
LAGEIPEKVQRLSQGVSGEDADETPHVSKPKTCVASIASPSSTLGISLWRTLRSCFPAQNSLPDQLVANLYRLNYGDNVL